MRTRTRKRRKAGAPPGRSSLILKREQQKVGFWWRSVPHPLHRPACRGAQGAFLPRRHSGGGTAEGRDHAAGLGGGPRAVGGGEGGLGLPRVGDRDRVPRVANRPARVRARALGDEELGGEDGGRRGAAGPGRGRRERRDAPAGGEDRGVNQGLPRCKHCKGVNWV